MCVPHRHQNPEKRPSFPDVVDELLAIEKDLPDTRYTEVTLFFIYCVILLFEHTVNLTFSNVFNRM